MTTPKIFDTDSGNAVVVAMDHGTSSGSVEGLSNPDHILNEILEGNPDGAIMRPHFARHYQELFEDNNCDVILTADYVANSTKPGISESAEIYSGAFGIDLIKSLDPTGVKLLLEFGRKDPDVHRRNVEFITVMAERLIDTDISVIVEPIMSGNQIPSDKQYNETYIKNGCRIGWELGADILKVPYPNDKQVLKEIVETTPVPLAILGGKPTDNIKPFFKDVSNSIEVGARGVMVGRRIWQNENPKKVIQTLNKIVHERREVNDVWD